MCAHSKEQETKEKGCSRYYDFLRGLLLTVPQQNNHFWKNSALIFDVIDSVICRVLYIRVTQPFLSPSALSVFANHNYNAPIYSTFSSDINSLPH